MRKACEREFPDTRPLLSSCQKSKSDCPKPTFLQRTRCGLSDFQGPIRLVTLKETGFLASLQPLCKQEQICFQGTILLPRDLDMGQAEGRGHSSSRPVLLCPLEAWLHFYEQASREMACCHSTALREPDSPARGTKPCEPGDGGLSANVPFSFLFSEPSHIRVGHEKWSILEKLRD